MEFPYIKVKKNTLPALLLLLLIGALVINGCKKKTSDVANILFKKSQNKVFNDFDPDDFAAVFKQVLTDQKARLTYPMELAAYYDKNGYEPTFLENNISGDNYSIITGYYDKSGEHGLSSRMFRSRQIKAIVARLNSGTGIKTINQAYHDVAVLELLTANSLINYSNDLQYGVINPKKIFSRYFLTTKRPDSIAINHVLAITDVKTYLDTIQPKDPQYVALQKAFLNDTQVPGLSPEESRRLLWISMERLRWKNKPAGNKYVIVNIPDFKLDVIDSGHSVLNMKVCVGQGRNMDYKKTLIRFDDTDRIDKPNPHETPLLNSLINSVQVNPVWNIPESIAKKEILVEAANDPDYLSNKNIDVYKNGKQVDDPDSIDWSTVGPSEYSFKQEPGDDNSLGKIKFLFDNHSNVYLHDTPAKLPFYRTMRAVSHGCVRLGDPEALALNLFGQGWQYKIIDKDMHMNKPDPTYIDLPKKTPVYITYVTCWADSTGTFQYRPDVYGLDIVLYSHLSKLVH
jgi:murein L,D-transpeptidase YcbB/YkuD